VFAARGIYRQRAWFVSRFCVMIVLVRSLRFVRTPECEQENGEKNFMFSVELFEGENENSFRKAISGHDLHISR
jgi:hypothetical protein